MEKTTNDLVAIFQEIGKNSTMQNPDNKKDWYIFVAYHELTKTDVCNGE